MNGKRFNKGVIYSIVVAFMSVVIVALAGIFYTGFVSRKSDHRWCELLITLDDAYHSTPITNPVGIKVATQIHKLKLDLSC